jgi:hypothetical protein
MNITYSDQPVHREASFREAGLGDLLRDVTRLGPAPNRSREAFAIVALLAAVGVAITVTRPEPFASTVIVALTIAYFAVRWVLGVRKWDPR